LCVCSRIVDIVGRLLYRGFPRHCQRTPYVGGWGGVSPTLGNRPVSVPRAHAHFSCSVRSGPQRAAPFPCSLFSTGAFAFPSHVRTHSLAVEWNVAPNRRPPAPAPFSERDPFPFPCASIVWSSEWGVLSIQLTYLLHLAEYIRQHMYIQKRWVNQTHLEACIGAASMRRI